MRQSSLILLASLLLICAKATRARLAGAALLAQKERGSLQQKNFFVTFIFFLN